MKQSEIAENLRQWARFIRLEAPLEFKDKYTAEWFGDGTDLAMDLEEAAEELEKK